jgi:hypothetical protein
MNGKVGLVVALCGSVLLSYLMLAVSAVAWLRSQVVHPKSPSSTASPSWYRHRR